MHSKMKLLLAASSVAVYVGLGSSHAQAPSDDCCTAEATARIAASAGTLDVVGIKLGMPINDALAVLRAHNTDFQMQPPLSMRMELLPDVEFVLAAIADQTDPSSNGASEHIEVAFTPWPSDTTVWGIKRLVSYARDSRPAVTNVIAALREKYGPESGTTNTRLAQMNFGIEMINAYWVFDARGKPLPHAEAATFSASCGTSSTSAHAFSNNDSSFMTLQSLGAMRSRLNRCVNTVVFAEWYASDPRTEPKGLVNSFTVQMGNGFLRRSAYMATYDAVERTAAGEERRQLRDADALRPTL